MREKRISLILGLVATVLALAVTGALAQSDLPSTVTFRWSTQTNPAPTDWKAHFVRGLAVNQSNGDIYVAQDSLDATVASKIVKLDSAGGIVWSKGPDLLDSSSTVRATMGTNSLAGLAIDPLTSNLYVIIHGSDNVSYVHVLSSDGVWLRSFSTGMPSMALKPGAAFGGAFSDDGQKYLIAGMLEKLPGAVEARILGEATGSSYGGKLFTRSDNGTAADPSDDTWVPAGELLDNGEFCSGYMAPQATAFDRLGRAYVGEGDAQPKYHYYSLSYVRSHGAAAPYQMNRAIVTGGCYGMDIDGANNIWCAYGREPDSGTPKRVRCYSPEGIRLIGFVCTAVGGIITEPMTCAYDRLNDRIIVGGTAGTSVMIECWTPNLVAPPTVTFTGRVVDSATGEGIPYANAGFRASGASDYPCGGFYYPHGYWERGRADANGYFSFTKNVVYQPNYDPPQSYPIVPVASGPGYLSKRVYAHQIGPGGGDEKLVLPDIALESADVDSITVRLWGKEGMFDPQFEESGLFWIYRGDGNQTGESKGDYVARLGGYFSGIHGWYDRACHLLVDDEWLSNGQPFDKVWISVEYYMESSDPGPWDTLGVEVDVQGSQHIDTKRMVGTVFKSSSFDEDWYTATFAVDNVLFGNRGLKGTDLRVNSIQNEPPTNPKAEGYARDWVRSVTISKVPPSGHQASATIAQARQAGSGSVILEDKVLTAQWNGSTFYLEEPDRTSGIKVVLPDPWVDPTLAGQVDRLGYVSGTLAVNPSTGEAEIRARSFGTAAGADCGPLGMTSVSATSGLDVTGLKVSVWGVVSDVSTGSFVVDDGAGGVKVVIAPSVTITWPEEGDFVAVVGIASLEAVSPSGVVRIVKPWKSGNVLIVASP